MKSGFDPASRGSRLSPLGSQPEVESALCLLNGEPQKPKRRGEEMWLPRSTPAGCLVMRGGIKVYTGTCKAALKCIPSHNQGLQPASTQGSEVPSHPTPMSLPQARATHFPATTPQDHSQHWVPESKTSASEPPHTHVSKGTELLWCHTSTLW